MSEVTPIKPSRRTTPRRSAGEGGEGVEDAVQAPPAEPEDRDFTIQSLRNQISRQSAQISELEAILLKAQYIEQQKAQKRA